MIVAAGVVAVVALMGASPALAAPQHGISFTKGCNAFSPIGEPDSCAYSFGNNVDEAQDTLTFNGLTDVVHAFPQPGGDVSSGNIFADLEYVVGAFTPGFSATPFCTGGTGTGTAVDPFRSAPGNPLTSCTLPFGSRLDTLDQSFYTVQAADFNLPGNELTDSATLTWQDLCDGLAAGPPPGGGNCVPNPPTVGAGSATIVQQLASSTATQIHDAAHNDVTVVAAGSVVHDFVTVTGQPGAAVPTGNVTVDFFSGDQCVGAPVATSSPISLDAKGTVDATGFAQGPVSAGFYGFQAHYAGDSTYAPSDGACEALQVIDANIQVSPLQATNPVGANDLLNAQVYVNDGTGFVDAPDGTQISFTIDSGPGSFTTSNPCTTGGATGTCQIRLVSNTPGTTVVSAHVILSVGGVSLTRDTNGTSGNSSPATKLWTDDVVTTHVRDASNNDITGSTSVAPGTVVHDQATVASAPATPPAVPDPTGTVTFTLFTGNTCNGAILATDPNEPLSGGLATSVTFTPAAGEPYSYLAHYNGNANYAARDAGCESFTVANQVDLSVSKSGPAYGAVGVPASYALTVDNAGPNAATGVVVSDPLPTGTSLVSVSSSQGTCDHSVSCSLGSMRAGGSAKITIVLRPTATGTVTEAASVSSVETDSNPTNNNSSVRTRVVGFAPGGGAFVIGNDTVTGTVTFWATNWSMLNKLSGGTAPSAFKGFALNPSVPACGSPWNTVAGSSPPPPPGPLPTTMAVIVTSRVTKAGGAIDGTTVHIVIATTNPGYNLANFQAGTGTVIATLC
jgi:uncharacterized repeat protein (TIGR01451 family)